MKNILFLFSFICFINSARAYEMDYVPYRKGNLYGISNRNGKLLIQPRYKLIQISPPYYFAYIGDSVTILNKELHTIGTFKGRATAYLRNFIIVENFNRENTLLDSLGNVIFKEYKDLVIDYREGIFIVNAGYDDGKWYGVILNAKAQKLGKFQSKQKPKVYNGRVYYVSDNKLSISDTSGHIYSADMPINAEYSMEYGFTVFHDKNGYGVYNNHCKLIVPQQTDYIITLAADNNYLSHAKYFNIYNAHYVAPKPKTAPNNEPGKIAVLPATSGSEYKALPSGPVGIMDTTGKIIAKPKYLFTSRLFKNYYLVTDTMILNVVNHKSKILDKDGREVFGYSVSVLQLNNNIAQISKMDGGKNLIGLINNECQWLSPAKYSYMNNDGSQRYMIAGKGKCSYSSNCNESENKDNCQFGLIDQKGREAVPLQFDCISHIHGIYIARLHGKFSIIDTTGKELYPYNNEFRTVRIGNKENSCIRSNGKWVILDDKSRNVSGQIYDTLKYSLAAEGFVFRRNGSWYTISSKGVEIPNDAYDLIKANNGGVIFVKNKEGWGALNQDCKVIIKPAYTRIEMNESGNYIVTYSDKGRGLIDKTGNILAKCQYMLVDTYPYGYIVNDGLIMVNNGENQKYRDYIDVDGREYFEE